MSRRRCFTIDEALAELMIEDEDEFLLGEVAEVSGSSSDGFSSDEDDRQACAGFRGCSARSSTLRPPVDHRISSDGLFAASSSGVIQESNGVLVLSENESESEDSNHFLERHVNPQTVAREYIDENGEGSRASANEADRGNYREDGGHPAPGIVCGCSKACLRKFPSEEILLNRLNMREMTKGEKELLLMGVLYSTQFDSEKTTKGLKRQHQYFDYCFRGEKICAGAFRYIFDIGQKYLKNLKKNLAENGPVPRRHGNSGKKPHNALSFADVEACAKFLKHYGEEFGIPHPAPLHGRDAMPPTYLPASKTVKSVHADYVASCRAENDRAHFARISVFRSIWKSCFPHLQIMSARTDVCAKCEKHRQAVSLAVEEQEKADALAEFTLHMQHAQEERDYYREATRRAHEELAHHDSVAAPPYTPCSKTNLKSVHYTFDFAQQVTLPHLARQPGPLYFKTPRKVQLFGVCSEGVPEQVNYLLDEVDTIGPNGTKSHGANSVVSLLHDYFSRHGHGEVECVLHADNCAGQNKNGTVIAYLAWRVIVGLHSKISLSFMIAGHTRCLVDGCFGLLKRKYRKSDIFTLEQLAATVDSSATPNVAQLGGVNWYAWDQYFNTRFKKIKGISKLQHFSFDAEKPGEVLTKKTVTSPPTTVQILKVDAHQLSAAELPQLLPRGGMTQDRSQYLFKEIREFVPPAFQDDLCPLPEDQQ